MEKWIDVVTEPLGLAGFGLCLVFILLTKLQKARNTPWIMAAFIGMACLALTGGLWLAYETVNTRPVTAHQETPDTVYQKTEGDFSPALHEIKGNVTITIQKEENIENKDKP